MSPIPSLRVIACVTALIATAAGGLACTKSPVGPGLRGEPSFLAISSVSPNEGIAGAPTLVTVSGTGFQSGVALTFGGVTATVTGVSANAITAASPRLSEGRVDVIVTNPNAGSATLAGAYTYKPVALTANPARVAAGAPLSVTWSVASGRSRFDWIGLFEADAPSTSYANGWWQYTEGAAEGAFIIDAPARHGAYEFRYLLDDEYVDVARSTVTVGP